MANKIKFKIKSDKFTEFISKLEDLTKISDIIKLKLDSQDILIYSILGSGRVMLAFKSYVLKTSEYLDYSDDLDFSIGLVIVNAKKFVKNLLFIKNSEKITMEITYKESADDEKIMNARSVQIVGGKLKVNWISGEHYEIRDIDKKSLDQRLDLKNRKWSFVVEKSEFDDVKKLSSINSEKIININVSNSKVIFSEKGSWEMEIGSTNSEKSANLILNKKFINCINDTSNIEFNLFDTFMLIKDEENSSDLMLSYEQDFQED